MNVKEFAEKYAGREADIRKGLYDQQYIVKIIGHTKYAIIVQFDDIDVLHDSSMCYNNSYDEINDESAGWYLVIPDDGRIIYNNCFEIENLIIRPLPPAPSNEPDNCDDCGAIGEEECKIGCPNK